MVRTPQELQDELNAAQKADDPNKKGPANVGWALSEAERVRSERGFFKSYYKGKHRLMIKDDRLRSVFGRLFRDFRMNLCKPVVEAMTDRMIVQSFSLEMKDGEGIAPAPPSPGAQPEAPPQLQGEQPGPTQGGSAPPVTPTPKAEQKGAQPARPASEKPASEKPQTVPGDKRPADDKQRVPEGAAKPVDPNAEQPVEQLQEKDLPETEADIAWKIWKRNRMGRRSRSLHKEAVSSGEAHMLVWRDKEGRATLYPQKPHEIVVEYEDENPGVVKKAAKVWFDTQDDGRKLLRVNLYYKDRIERYATEKKEQTDPKPEDFKPFAEDGEPAKAPHPWGVVPVFPFANNADLGEEGESELLDAVPIQDMGNYLVFTLLVSAEFGSMPQKYLLNVETPRDPETGELVNPFETGTDRLWMFASGSKEDHPPQIGQFPAGDLLQLVGVMDFVDRRMATVTGTPIHYFFVLAGAQFSISGEAQKTADAKLGSKVEDRQEAFGDSWAKCMALAVRMELDDPQLDIELGTNWKDTRPRNETEMWTIAGQKKAAGVSQKQILREMGYTEQQISVMRKENQENQASFGFPTDATVGDHLEKMLNSPASGGGA